MVDTYIILITPVVIPPNMILVSLFLSHLIGFKSVFHLKFWVFLPHKMQMIRCVKTHAKSD